jgi:CMP-N-acetylneuraminic acid synthetase/GT2 family glycosyltransferase
MKISIIIRTKNEERWIAKCLESLKEQTIKDFEVILVDNKSTDKTLEKARICGVKKIFTIDKYLPGKALNLGIKKSNSEYIVCLSAHCIPKNKLWLKNLLKNIEKKNDVAGVYGRQEPMEFSSDSDKRDLLLVFGLDKKIQIKDTFFHNANSIISRKVWKKINFDDKISNIEDRIWGQEVVRKGYKIIYEPEASVYHYHGIHQNGNTTRLKNVINIIHSQNSNFSEGQIDPVKLNIVAIIPSKSPVKKFGDKHLLSFTIQNALKSKYIKKIYVSTDSKEVQKVAVKYGAKCTFLRPKNLSKKTTNLEEVQKFSIRRLEEQKVFPDLVVHLEETFPFRDEDLIDKMIITLLKNGYDTVIAAKEECGWMWQENSEKFFIRIDEGDVPREFKKKSFIGLHGVCCITYPEYLRKGRLLGKNVGLYHINSSLSYIEIRDKESFKKFSSLIS